MKFAIIGTLTAFTAVSATAAAESGRLLLGESCLEDADCDSGACYRNQMMMNVPEDGIGARGQCACNKVTNYPCSEETICTEPEFIADVPPYCYVPDGGMCYHDEDCLTGFCDLGAGGTCKCNLILDENCELDEMELEGLGDEEGSPPDDYMGVASSEQPPEGDYSYMQQPEQQQQVYNTYTKPPVYSGETNDYVDNTSTNTYSYSGTEYGDTMQQDQENYDDEDVDYEYDEEGWNEESEENYQNEQVETYNGGSANAYSYSGTEYGDTMQQDQENYEDEDVDDDEDNDGEDYSELDVLEWDEDPPEEYEEYEEEEEEYGDDDVEDEEGS